ncbi:MAG TPA: glycosyl hydrolase family 8 [Stellaceae bacterium]|jgi:endoglucanase|nr:glycosyl hydrolase family 8 [Stellaceae bacterium]
MRLLFPVLFILLALAAPAHAGDPSFADQWGVYRDRFVTGDGRVRDTGNKDVSHTEGQGWAMLFAESADDRAAFDNIWDWTRAHLRQPDSALFAWRWDPADPQHPIADPNNASDGDTLIAWALIRAAKTWNDTKYRDAARRILGDIRDKLLAAVARRLVLLPGRDGFTRDDGSVVLNPSYYIYPAFKNLERTLPGYQWRRLRGDGLALLDKAQFGPWHLPSDWIALDPAGAVTPAVGFAPQFGFAAIRVPLYLVWAGDASPKRLQPYLDFWAEFGDKPPPAWADVSNGKVAPYPASNGVQAVVQFVRGSQHRDSAPLPVIGADDDYYSASLVLLARLARRETAG